MIVDFDHDDYDHDYDDNDDLISWDHAAGFDDDKYLLCALNNFQTFFIPQTALGNHMESLGRTLMEKVAEVSGKWNGKLC